MIELINLTLRIGSEPLIENMNITIFPKNRVGLVGKNGCGKTSLFSLMLKQREPDLGELKIPANFQVAHVAQETPSLDIPAFEFVLAGDPELMRLRAAELAALDAGDGMAISEICQKLNDIDGYRADARAASLLHGLGFEANEINRPVKSFSGGWRMRLNLAHALMCRSDILLLDEPTNHLDFETVVWLEGWLKAYQGTLIIISHDREFLDNITDRILHIEHKQATLYSGNYTAFERIRAEKLILQASMIEKQEKTKAHLQDFITRFKAKASKAKQAQSRIKALERMENLAPILANSPFSFSFFTPLKRPNPLLVLDKISIAYNEDKTILQDTSLTFSPDVRLGILGKNGSGKSSLIKLIAGMIQPTSGTYLTADGLKIGYFAQHQVDYLNINESPVWHIQQIDKTAALQDLRNFVGGFGFHGDQALTAITKFSGGEKARLALAIIVYQKPNLLLLDEPTNHLDLEMREALAVALQEYEGGLLMVSHDASLLESCCDEFLWVHNKSVQYFKGDLQDYRLKLIELEREETRAVQSNQGPKQGAIIQQNRKALQAEIRRHTRTIEQAENKISKIQEKITNLDQLIFENSTADLLKERMTLNEQIRKLETQWLESQTQLDALEK